MIIFPMFLKENWADLHIFDQEKKTVKNYAKISGSWNSLNALIDNIDAIQYRLITELGLKDE